MNNHMRQGNNNKRSRGRGRKPQNSSNRAYDSTGPDVKIRGTAAHVCEKYQQLARDALSAGDRVTAENYYQHAEHYYRLLMASQVVNDGQPRPQNNLGYRPQEDEEEDFDQNEQGGEQNFQPQQQRQQHQSYNNNGNNNGGHRQQGEYSQGGVNGNHPRAQQAQPQPQQAEFAAEGEEQPATPDSAYQPAFSAESGAVQQPQGDGQRRRDGRRRRRRPEGGGAPAGGTEGREDDFDRAASGEEAL